MKRRQDQEKQAGVPVSLFSPSPFSFDGCVLVTAEGVSAALSQEKLAAASYSFSVGDVSSRSNNARGVGTDAFAESRHAGGRHGGSTPAEMPLPPSDASTAASSGRGLTCGLCKEAFVGVSEQRAHFKSDWHKFNVWIYCLHYGRCNSDFSLRAKGVDDHHATCFPLSAHL